MTDAEMDATIKVLVGDSRYDGIVSVYREMAKDIVLRRVFPFVETPAWADVPTKYHTATCDIACYLVNKRGAEGETSHNENGISRTYESASVPDSMLACIVPFVGVPE